MRVVPFYHMQRPLIVANWKAYLGFEEVTHWMDVFQKGAPDMSNKTIVLAPSSIFLSSVSSQIKTATLPVGLAAQDVSMYERGAVTGEVAAEVLKAFVI